MIPVSIIATITLLYFGLLFSVAFYADKKREAGQSFISNSYIYALSLTVYFTAWTFYGNVGRAATSGLDFLAPQLGSSLMVFTWWFLLRKIVRVSKEQHIVTIADFISSRYGKSVLLGSIVTIFSVLGALPYIALQLKAVTRSFELLSTTATGGGQVPAFQAPAPFFDTGIVVALFLGLFGVLYGARHLDASERHEGLVAAIAVESMVKLTAMFAAGLFVTFGLFDGPADIFSRFVAVFPDRTHLLRLGTEPTHYATWFTLSFTSMMGVMLLPRQFHIMVTENTREEHIIDAMWRFPAYMFLINLFIIPVALGGLLLHGGDTTYADYFILLIPLETGHPVLAMLIFIGGFSASAGMVMVSSVALSNMILNHLVMPLILKLKTGAKDLSGILINIKRLGIVVVIFLGYFYYRLFGETYALINIGLASFVAVTQFAPSFIGGLYWKRANRRGAIVGLILGFLLWSYTLLIPSFVRTGWMPDDILAHGPFGLELLRPLALFGLDGFDMWTHSLFWTLLFNIGAFSILSVFTSARAAEKEQADKFVDIFAPQQETPHLQRISKTLTIMEFVDLMAKFIGEKQARAAIAEYLGDAEIDERGSLSEFQLPDLKRFTEKTLSGSVGSAPARIIVENYLATRGSKMEDVFDIFGSVTISRKAGREQLGVLHEITRMVAGRAELQSILDNILDLFRQQFKLDLCVIRMLDQERGVLAVRSQKGMSSEHLGESDRQLNRNSYVGEAFLMNSVIVVNDTDFMDKPIPAMLVHREGIKAFAHAPITIEGEPVGVLSAFSRSAKGIFSEEFIELFQSMAGQVGVAWRNASQTERLIEAREKERELEIARIIQSGLLPSTVPEIEGISLTGICVPAKEVGGDYYDFLPRSDGSLDIVIADVSGHNVGASLIMTETRTFIHARLESFHSAAETAAALNSFLYEDLTRAELFITMFYLKYHAASRELSFANAGHNPPLTWRAQSRSLEFLDAEGLILGVFSKVDFEEKRVRLHPGDLLLLYTDGIIEAENSEGSFFGESRLVALLEEHHDLSPQEIIDTLLSRVRLFIGTTAFNDDVSLVAIRVLR